MGKVKRGGGESHPIVAAEEAEVYEERENDESELDGAELDISSDDADDLPSGSDAEGDEEVADDGDAELRAALIEYQTMAARLREEEAAGGSNREEHDDEEDEG